MSTLRLISLRLRNFKGIREFTLDANGGNVAVFGDNATGKTTLADAFMWLLFDKDSKNRKDFEIKTLGPDGEPIHGLEHEVEGVLEVDGQRVTLRKVYQEQWTKKRGSATKEFTGHTTDHFIDGAPSQLKEYKDRVAKIADESTFRLLTDPNFFNEQLHWTKRREVLLTVCGDVTDQDVISSNGALAGLPDILRNRTLADHRKVILARRSEINKELEKIPVRIDEVAKGLPAPGGDRQELQAQIGRLREARQAKAAEQVRIQAGGEVAEKQKRLREIEGEMLTVQQRIRASADQAVQQERTRLAGVTDQIDAKRRELKQLKSQVDESELEITQLQARMDALRKQWHEVDQQVFSHTQDENCPACGQALPQERLHAAHEKALAEFNSAKAARLESIVAEGKRHKARVEELTAGNQQRRAAMDQVSYALAGLETQAREIQARMDRLRSEVPDFTQDAAYKSLQAEKAQVEQEIANLRTGSAEALGRVTQALYEIDGQIGALEAALGQIDQRERGLARIEELKAQERDLAAEFERLAKELYLTEEFIRSKVRLLEERINSRFKHARFKLFNQNNNGGVEECCETLYEGVPYSTGLNTGACMMVGLDIINTLSEYYGFEAPIWIDNREAVTRLIPTRAQVISLVVSEPDKTLRVEREAARQLTLEAV